MSAQTFQPIDPRPAPVKTEGIVAWIRINLFGDWITGLMTVVIVCHSSRHDHPHC
jgi:general L-amino acid transport system permease protein